MRKRFSFITSLFMHLILVILFLLSDFEEDISEEDESLEIQLIKKENYNTNYHSSVSSNETAVISGTDMNSLPELVNISSSNYLTEMDDSPVISDNSMVINSSSSAMFHNEDFETSLSALAPDVLDEIEDETDFLSIKWEGDKRSPLSGTDIDFSKFPSESFTGVGVKASFSVNRKGEVYDVYIMPPGSGSVEFDILVKSYVSKFSFSEGESVSRGEVYIVYKK